MVDECLSLKPMDCYNGYYATTCCKTCSALVQNPSDATCLYGDKGVGCSDMVPAVCHLSTKFCCQTCAAYLSSSNIIDTSSVTSLKSVVFSNNSNTASMASFHFLYILLTNKTSLLTHTFFFIRFVYSW